MEQIPGYTTHDLVLSDYSAPNPPGLFSAVLCDRCGAIVGSTDTHDAWHDSLKNTSLLSNIGLGGFGL